MKAKGQISLNFHYKVNFKDFVIPKCVCVLTNKIYRTNRTGFCSDAWIMPRMGLGGAGVPKGSKNSVWNMVMYHIILTGMMRATEYK